VTTFGTAGSTSRELDDVFAHPTSPRVRTQLMRGIPNARDLASLRALQRHLTEGRVQIKLFTRRPCTARPTFATARTSTARSSASWVLEPDDGRAQAQLRTERRRHGLRRRREARHLVPRAVGRQLHDRHHRRPHRDHRGVMGGGEALQPLRGLLEGLLPPLPGRAGGPHPVQRPADHARATPRLPGQRGADARPQGPHPRRNDAR